MRGSCEYLYFRFDLEEDQTSPFCIEKWTCSDPLCSGSSSAYFFVRDCTLDIKNKRNQNFVKFGDFIYADTYCFHFVDRILETHPVLFLSLETNSYPGFQTWDRLHERLLGVYLNVVKKTTPYFLKRLVSLAENFTNVPDDFTIRIHDSMHGRLNALFPCILSEFEEIIKFTYSASGFFGFSDLKPIVLTPTINLRHLELEVDELPNFFFDASLIPNVISIKLGQISITESQLKKVDASKIQLSDRLEYIKLHLSRSGGTGHGFEEDSAENWFELAYQVQRHLLIASSTHKREICIDFDEQFYEKPLPLGNTIALQDVIDATNVNENLTVIFWDRTENGRVRHNPEQLIFPILRNPLPSLREHFPFPDVWICRKDRVVPLSRKCQVKLANEIFFN